MSSYMYIFSLIVLIVNCYAAENNKQVKNFEGPWNVRNASKNALPFIGKCPSMKIESTPRDSGIDGLVLMKTTLKTLTLTIVRVDHENYELFLPTENNSSLIGNISVIHAEENSYLITELQTEDEVYYAVLIKTNETSEDTDRKIEKTWKSSKPSGNVSLTPIEYKDCPDEIGGTSIEHTTKTSEVKENKISLPTTEKHPIVKDEGRERQKSEQSLAEKNATVQKKNITINNSSTEGILVSDKLSTASPPASKTTQKENHQPLISDNNTRHNIHKGMAANICNSHSLIITCVFFYFFVKHLFVQ